MLDTSSPYTVGNDFTINFGGDTNDIDINTLITSLIGFSAAIQEIQNELYPGAKIEIKVRPPQKGSFLIDLVIAAYNNASPIIGGLLTNIERHWRNLNGC